MMGDLSATMFVYQCMHNGMKRLCVYVYACMWVCRLLYVCFYMLVCVCACVDIRLSLE